MGSNNEDIGDVEKYRKHWEIDKQWRLRKSFILAHQDHIPEDRLLCLAQVYVNMELLKNEYDDALMTEVRALAAKIDKNK